MADLGDTGYQGIEDSGTETDDTKTSTYNQKVIVAPGSIPNTLKTTCVVKSNQTDLANLIVLKVCQIYQIQVKNLCTLNGT